MKGTIPKDEVTRPRQNVSDFARSFVRRIFCGIDCLYVTIFLLLSVIDPAVAGLKEGEEMPRESVSYPGPGFRS